MIEAAILLPLILVVIFIAIGLSVLANGRSALTTGMTSALRLATTRGDRALMGNVALLGPVETYFVSAGNDLSPLQTYVTSGDIDPLDTRAFLNRCFGEIYGTNRLKDLPRQYQYLLVYLNQALRESIGPSLRFPCVPPGGAPPSNYTARCPTNAQNSGCVACYLLNPDTLSFTPATTPQPTRIALRCEYSPSSIFLKPIWSALSLFSGGSGEGGIVITRDRMLEITQLGG